MIMRGFHASFLKFEMSLKGFDKFLLTENLENLSEVLDVTEKGVWED